MTSSAHSAHRAVAVAQMVVAALVIVGIWVALPARYLLVDAVGTGLAALYTASAVGLLTHRS